MVTLDTLELRIYPLDQNLNIHEFKIKILDFIDPIIKHFIWMGERPFSNIYVDRNPPCLREECNIGPDGVDDEWFIYHVVILLSLHLKKMAAITLRDTDGEFLLIEAAEHLPDWLDPDNSYNRVFIFNGSLHIIPIERMPISSIYMALDELALNPSSSIASPSIQKALSRRIVPFTSNRSSNTTVICDRMRLNEMQVLQKSKVIIPTRLASALKDDPSLISPISRALIEFYSPDQLDFTCYEKSSQSVFPKTFDFDPKNFLIGSEARMVPALVAFPRPIFARLLAHQIDSELTKKLSTYFFIREDDVSSEIGAKLVIGSHLALAKKKIKTLPQANDIVIEPYSGVEDDLGWLDIDLPIMMDDLDSKLSGIALTEKEADVIISKMSSPDDLEQHVSYSSAEPDGNKSQQGSWNSFEPSDDEYCSGSSSDSENVSENSDSMIEREIIEAVANDPDLLMKMIQRIEEFGFQDKGNVLRKLLDESERIIKCSKDGGTLLPVPVQKGIADIDPAKVSEARVPPSRTRFFNRNSSSDIPVDDVDNAAPLDESVYKIHSAEKVGLTRSPSMAGSEDNVNMSNSFIPRPNQRRQTVWNIEGNVIIQGDPCTQVAMMSSDWIPESSELQTASSLNNEQIPAHGMHLFSPYEMDQLINTIPTWILPSLPHPILPAGSSRDNTSRPEYQIRPAVFRGPLIANQRQQPATDSYVESLELNDEDEPVR